MNEQSSIHFIEQPPDAQALIAQRLMIPEVETVTLQNPVLEQGGERPVTELGSGVTPDRRSLLSRLGSGRLGRWATRAALSPGLLGGLTTFEATPAHATTTMEYTVTDDAAGGVYARTGPHSNDTERIPGDGIYPGDVVSLICGVTNGDSVDSHNNTIHNTTWHLVTDETRPNEGQFWVNDHYLSTPDDPGHLAPNERDCNSHDPVHNLPKSIFYSPLGAPTGLSDIKIVADINKSIEDWSSGDCSADKALKGVPSSVDTLAGWSKGRLGPVYYLAEANSRQRAQIHNIILLDPGATSDMARNRIAELRGKKTCDWRYDPSNLLADWLQIDGSNHLTIITGSDTEMKENSSDPNSRSTFDGLWKYYLADSWNQPFANRVTICDYNSMSHEQAMHSFANMIAQRRMGCATPAGYNLTEWHP